MYNMCENVYKSEGSVMSEAGWKNESVLEWKMNGSLKLKKKSYFLMNK